jgi:glycosyltransferase involved in cell wall biosynthesis
MTNRPLLSVILPVYNNGPELARAIASVTEQPEITNQILQLEIIIVNDGSNSDTRKRLEQLSANDSRIKLYHQDNAGPAAARNHAIRHAEGELISFIDGDDQWSPNKLSVLLPELTRPGINVAAGKIRYKAESGHTVPNMLYETSDYQISHVHLGSTIVKRCIFDRGLLFDETLKYSEDINWWYQLREQEVGIIIIEQPTLIYFIHSNNMSVGKSFGELNLVRVLKKSLERRRTTSKAQSTNPAKPVPQLNDYRIYQNPLVSIIIPLHNGASFIHRALDSILSQTYTHFEVILVDDGSTDEGATIAANHPLEIKVLYQPNLRQAAARNLGLAQAKGKYIAFLDQDDEWLPTKLAEQVSILNSHPGISWVTCNQVLKLPDRAQLPSWLGQELLQEHSSIMPSSWLVRAHVLAASGPFDTRLTAGEDTDLIVRWRHMSYEHANVDKLLLYKHQHSENASLNLEDMRKGIFEILRKKTRHKKTVI